MTVKSQARSKNRPLWSDLPEVVQRRVGDLVAGEVVSAANCPGGFSPGFASRLGLADGRTVFVKAIDADAWPVGAGMHRDEARIATGLSEAVNAPPFLGWSDDGHWVMLAFADVDGREPGQPWTVDDLERVTDALLSLPDAPLSWPADLPRLGGFTDLDRSDLAARSPWAAEHLDELIQWERRGLTAARGSSIVHCDAYGHNILLTGDRVYLVDWPHARRASPMVDLVTLASGVAADGFDPRPVLDRLDDRFPAAEVDAVLAAHAGFCLAGAVGPAQPGLQAIVDAKLRLGLATVDCLRRRRDGEAHAMPSDREVDRGD